MDAESWTAADPREVREAKIKYSECLAGNLISAAAGDKAVSPYDIVYALSEHALTVTHTSRQWLEQNDNRRLPQNYVEFPGKMDHSTVVAFSPLSSAITATDSPAVSATIAMEKLKSSSSPTTPPLPAPLPPPPPLPSSNTPTPNTSFNSKTLPLELQSSTKFPRKMVMDIPPQPGYERVEAKISSEGNEGP